MRYVRNVLSALTAESCLKVFDQDGLKNPGKILWKIIFNKW